MSLYQIGDLELLTWPSDLKRPYISSVPSCLSPLHFLENQTGMQHLVSGYRPSFTEAIRLEKVNYMTSSTVISHWSLSTKIITVSYSF